MSIPGISSGGSMELQGGDAKSGNGDYIGSAGDKFFNFGGSSEMPGWMMTFAQSSRGGGTPVIAGMDARGLLLLGAVGLSVYLLAKRR